MNRPWVPFLRGVLTSVLCFWAFGVFSPLALCLSVPCFALLESNLADRETNLLLIAQSWIARLALLGLAGYAALCLPGTPWTPGFWQHPAPRMGLVLAAGFVLTVRVGGDVIGAMMAPMAAQVPDKEGLPKGGAMIGCLERTLVLLFVLSGDLDGVGYVLAAKSVLRFSEIRDAKERREAEYIIVGTFASFTWAFLAAQATRIAMGLC